MDNARSKLIVALRAGIGTGEVKIRRQFMCSWCGRTFKTEEEFDEHLIDGKTTDPATGRLRRICPN